MKDLLIAMVFMFFMEGLHAFTATRKKEKMMINDGGEPLPQSAYVFLGIQYLFRILFGTMCILWLPTIPLNNFITLFIVYNVVWFLARFFEVLIRTVIVMILTKKYVKNSGITKE